MLLLLLLLLFFFVLSNAISELTQSAKVGSSIPKIANAKFMILFWHLIGKGVSKDPFPFSRTPYHDPEVLFQHGCAP